MYFDDYSTSLQSLYSPMYNLQGNYNVTAGANGNAGSTSTNGSATANGNNAGMGYPGMLGYTPMSNVGVGQFGADQLIKSDGNQNNYYARPIAPHKKKDDVPMMLGILGTALGTGALLLALLKGRKGGAAPVVAPPVTPTTTKKPYVPPTTTVTPAATKKTYMAPTTTVTPSVTTATMKPYVAPAITTTTGPITNPSRLLPYIPKAGVAAPTAGTSLPGASTAISGGSTSLPANIISHPTVATPSAAAQAGTGSIIPLADIINPQRKFNIPSPIKGFLPSPTTVSAATTQAPAVAMQEATQSTMQLKPLSEIVNPQGTLNIPSPIKGFLPSPTTVSTATTQAPAIAMHETTQSTMQLKPLSEIVNPQGTLNIPSPIKGFLPSPETTILAQNV